MTSTFIQRYFFTALLFLAFAVGFIIFWPFLITIILGIVFSVLLHPLYKWIVRYVRFPSLASFLTILSFIIILCMPLFLIGLVVIKQSQTMLDWLSTHGSLDTAVNNLTIWLHNFFPHVSFDLQAKVNAFVAGLASKGVTVFTATISTLISFLLLLLTMYYFLKDGKSWTETVIAVSPLSEESNTKIITVLQKAINGIVKGYLVIGLAQGVVTGIGLFIFHVPHAVLWGLLAAVASLIPNIGTGLISIPVVIFLFLSNKMGPAIGYALWAIFISGTVDNVLNPFVVGKQIAIHPMLVLFSVLGGITLLGPVGLIIGPLVVSLIYALTSVYKHEMAIEN
ncbi:MAG: AI-2E family transporter [Candidatus Paceibacterota bacterium]